jgi:hypothetical protein
MIRATLSALLLASLVCVTAGAGGAGAAGSACPTSNPPNTLELQSGTPQTARLNSVFGQPLQVELANTNGCPLTTSVAGTPVTFSAPGSGASATFVASGADSVVVGADGSGMASAQLAANGSAGAYTVVASSTYGTVTFSLTNSASGLPAAIAAQAPRTRAAYVGATYAQPLAVTVRDANGNPVSNASVTFALGSGGGGSSGTGAAGATFADGSAQAVEQTDASGIARSPLFTANGVAGTFTASASVQGVVDPAQFILENVATAAPSLTTAGRSSLRAVVGRRYGRRLEARLVTAAGTPVAGAEVTFTLGAAGGSGGASSAGATFVGGAVQAVATTNRDGVAVSPRLVANTVAGTFTATASTAEAAAGVTYALRNLAGQPAVITAGAASGESTATGTRFPVRLAVTVDDAYGNPVAKAVVTFVAPKRGSGGRFRPHHARVVRVATDAHGIAVAPPFLANRLAGGYVVRARVRGLGRSAAFALVNRSS